MKTFVLSIVLGFLPILVSFLQWYDVWFDFIIGELLSSFIDGDSYDFIIGELQI